jgi:TonB family protein
MFLSRFATLGSIFLLAGSIAVAQEPSSDKSENPGPPSVPIPHPSRIRIGGNVAAQSLISQVIPHYPELAKTAHIEGTVVLHALIGRDGNMMNLEYVSGPPLLMKAAMEAVKQWQYKPVRLNGEPVEVDTMISVVFTLGEKPPTEPAKQAATTTPTPSSEPAPPAMTEPTYPDTLDGLKSQTQAAFEAWRSTYKQDYFVQLHGFAMPDPKTWLATTFGPEKGAALLPEYGTSFGKFEAHMTYVSGLWEKSGTSYLIVEPSVVPNSPDDDEKGGPPKPLVPLRVENFRFMAKTGQEDPNDWVFSFVYLDGAFRIIGGTHTFWDENWRLKHNEAALAAGKSNWQLAYADPSVIEGVVFNCPGDGLLRVFVAAKVQATRLKEKPEPVYPEAARKAGIQGIVLLHAIISADGTIKELEFEDGDRILASSAEEAVRKWRYEPLKYHDRPTEVDTVIAVEFKLLR